MQFTVHSNLRSRNSAKVRFGIIGTNFITDWIIEASRQEPRFELTALYSRTVEQADKFADKYQIPHRFASLEKMAESDKIDAVYIASPNALHASQSILFLQNGKHVLCEKPFASNAKEAEKMILAARNNKRVLMEAMKSTLTPNFLTIKDNLNKLGTVRRYFSSYCQYSSRYDKFKQGEILNAFKPELSNGATMDLGIYTIYPMVVLFGRPKKVEATGIVLSTGADGQGAVNFEYEGMNATVLYSKIADSFLPTEIQGEEGTLTADRINTIGSVSLRYRNGNKTDLTMIHNNNEYYYELAEFIDLIESGKMESAVNSHENSYITMEIIDEIRKQLGVVYPADAIL